MKNSSKIQTVRKAALTGNGGLDAAGGLPWFTPTYTEIPIAEFHAANAEFEVLFGEPRWTTDTYDSAVEAYGNIIRFPAQRPCLDAAIKYAADRDWHVFPAPPGEKK